jgi:pimeloyl-ACP methyl ester carboxylesterase
MSSTGTLLAERTMVGGVEVELFSRGQGVLLLYLHAGDGAEYALPLVEHLARSFKVIMPSHPGFGGSALPPEITSVDDLAYFYLDLLDTLALRDVVLVGASFGGWIAAEIAVRNASRLSHLVLTGSVGVKFGGREDRDIADLFAIRDRDLPQFCRHEGRADDRDYATLPVETVERMVRNREALTLFGWAPTLFNPKLRQRLHRIGLPTLLLWGESDCIVAPDYGRAFAAAIPGAEFAIIRHAGHYAHLDQPEELARRIGDFAG